MQVPRHNTAERGPLAVNSTQLSLTRTPSPQQVEEARRRLRRGHPLNLHSHLQPLDRVTGTY